MCSWRGGVSASLGGRARFLFSADIFRISSEFLFDRSEHRAELVAIAEAARAKRAFPSAAHLDVAMQDLQLDSREGVDPLGQADTQVRFDGRRRRRFLGLQIRSWARAR